MTNFKDIAYEIIRKKIITCEIMPGTVVDQNALMKEIGVSRTPVRDAISALEQEGLLVVMPRRGVIVSHISFNEINQIYTVREALEPLIVKLAIPNVDKDRLYDFRSVFQKDNVNLQDLCQCDYDMHRYFAEKSGNHYLIRTMDSVLAHNMRIVVIGANIPDRMIESNKEHVRIIDMMLEGNAAEAQEAMRHHIVSARNIALLLNKMNI